MNQIANDLPRNARSLLFLPADRPERLAKALASGAHLVVLDLEDAVAPEAKPAARAGLLERWTALDAADRARIALRVNAHGTPWHAADCALAGALAESGLAAVMLAKAESPAQLIGLAARTGGPALLPLVESAEGLHAANALAQVPGVARLVFGHLDFQLDTGIDAGPDERELDAARFALVLASRRARIAAPVDGVTVDIADAARLAADAARARRQGFGAKLCIHPAQVAAVNGAFGPDAAQLDWARRVLDAALGQPGAFRFEGAMVDAPVLARARALLA